MFSRKYLRESYYRAVKSAMSDRIRSLWPETGMDPKSGSGIAGNGMLFQNSGSGKAEEGMLF